MSRYTKELPSGRILSFGLDKASGGYFWQEFLSEAEIAEREDEDEDLIVEEDGLCLTALIDDLKNYGYIPPIDALVNDFFSEENPTALQIHVGKMFNKDISSMLLEVMNDVVSWTKRN